MSVNEKSINTGKTNHRKYHSGYPVKSSAKNSGNQVIVEKSDESPVEP